jgi:hypothetical protein
MSEKVYVGDIGTIIEIDMQENISTATELKLKVRKPDGTQVEWTPSIYGTNYLRYTLQVGDLDMAGTYALQPYMTIGTWTGRGDTVSFTVYDYFI